jgi:hypothetical protein
LSALQPAAHPALPSQLHVPPHAALVPQLASHDESPPVAGAASAQLPAANAINISPRAKIVFLPAVMFVSFSGL